jgi:hypothetical protein
LQSTFKNLPEEFMKRQNRLTTSAQEQETQASAQEARQDSVNEFKSAEEMLRHDALHTPVPPAIAHRLQQSLRQSPSPSNPWWRKLFGA